MFTSVLFFLIALFFLVCLVESRIELSTATRSVARLTRKVAKRESMWAEYADHIESDNRQFLMIIASMRRTGKDQQTTIAKLSAEITQLKSAKHNQQSQSQPPAKPSNGNNGNGKTQSVTQPALTGMDLASLGIIAGDEQGLIDMWTKQNTPINVIAERIQTRRNKANKQAVNN